VRAGLRRARAGGKRLGRPPVQVDPTRLASALRRKLSVPDAARELGISSSSYARLVRLHQAGTHRRSGAALGIDESNATWAAAAPGVTETLAPSAL